MAVADAVLPSPPPLPPPPPARIVVVVLVLVRFALAPMLALGRVLRVAARALPYLCFAFGWVISAASAAQVVARRAWGEGSAPFLFIQALVYGALKVWVYSFLVLFALAVLLLCSLCVAYVIAAVSGSTSGFKKSVFGAITREPVRLPRAAVLGLVADVAFFLLMVAGLLVAMMSPHVEGSISQGAMVASLVTDVAIFGIHATACFVIIPALVLNLWREDQADRKAPSQFCQDEAKKRRCPENFARS
ncbi:uncharacterized protein LOC119362541 [Triticum dicoccoides]|uniref:uncharacterized protein LOC119362541 n=1 Tax=Triticum dicoccoides TaxID=85692 RepID=UPI00188F0AD6|nr:uncharacterized protein LOC119362541 [Triticum dicoccoides]